jgi:hypothetical protein
MSNRKYASASVQKNSTDLRTLQTDMIKTLRITTVVVTVILAGVLIKYFVLPMDSNVGADQRVEKVLDSPGVIELFKQTNTHARAVGNQTSPLVQQAIAYARYLSPPSKIKQALPGVRTTTNPIATGPVTPKFQVFATTYFEGNPQLSQALIDEPGKGRYWVRQSSMVGHLLIEQVKDGVVVVKSSEETFELEVEKASKTGLPKGKSPIPTGTSGQSSNRRTLPAPGKTVNSSTTTPSGRTPSAGTPSRTTRPNNNAISSEKADELERTLQNLERSYRLGGKTVPGLSGEESAARVRKLLSSFRSTTANAEDVKGQTAPGEKLKDNGQDPNRTSPASKSDKIETDLEKPDPSTP